MPSTTVTAQGSPSLKAIYTRCYNLACASCLLWYNPGLFFDQQDLYVDVDVYNLHPETAPSASFVRFAVGLVAHSRVPHHTLSLALNYIFRFTQQLGPDAVAAMGSEYVLLTTALMLANKLHDDVSYTTMSWAQMSRIAATELTVAERTLLGGLDYSLALSKSAWLTWQQNLGRVLNVHAQFRKTPMRVYQAMQVSFPHTVCG